MPTEDEWFMKVLCLPLTKKQHVMNNILCGQGVNTNDLETLFGQVYPKTHILIFAYNFMLSRYKSVNVDTSASGPAKECK